MTKDSDSKKEMVYQQSFVVRIHEINQEGNITIPSLLKLLQETSMQHILKLKTSVWDLKDLSISWILLTKQLKIERLPRKGEKITILTYPTGFEKFFAYRDYLVFDAEKNLIATTSSKWSLINTDTRKLTRVPEKLNHLAVGDEVKKLTRPLTKLPMPPVADLVRKEVIESYDLDWNGHVNNIRLCKSMLQALLTKGAIEEKIKVVDIQFKNESHEGDLLDISVSSELNYAVIKRDEKHISSLMIS